MSANTSNEASNNFLEINKSNYDVTIMGFIEKDTEKKLEDSSNSSSNVSDSSKTSSNTIELEGSITSITVIDPRTLMMTLPVGIVLGRSKDDNEAKKKELNAGLEKGSIGFGEGAVPKLYKDSDKNKNVGREI